MSKLATSDPTRTADSGHVMRHTCLRCEGRDDELWTALSSSMTATHTDHLVLQECKETLRHESWPRAIPQGPDRPLGPCEINVSGAKEVMTSCRRRSAGP